PILADAKGVASVAHDGVVAHPGYTLVSEAGYAYVLIVAVLGLVRLLDYLDAGNQPKFFYGLVPFGFLGGAVRVVEDTGTLEWPLNFFFISPVIYFTMFFVTVALLSASVRLESEGYVESYARPLAVSGSLLFGGVVGYLFYFGYTNNSIVAWVPPTVLVLTTLTWGAVWFGVERFFPVVNQGTGRMGAVLLWGHLLDASATTVGIEYLGYGEKHPVVQAIIRSTGTTYTFIPVKAGVVLVILYAFDEKFFEESDRLPYLLLVAMLAVGLGPGTRNALRATIGV
ncbi:MAG: DUF63 family protein, partial [Halobacteria archaeon]|nr:DUF63 family protein [Halobacteria archaeon]